MQLKEIYTIAIELGKQTDPRGKEGVDAELAELRRSYDAMTEVQKVAFNTERLENPYADSMILHGDPDKEIRSVMVGIDIETGEIVLADRLRERRGGNLDLVIAHHPEGRALAGFYDVMYMQADILNRAGVPINIGESLIQERHTEVERGIMPINHTRTVDNARLLDVPLMCVHTPADNCVVAFLEQLFEEKSPRVLRDIISILKELPEYKLAMDKNAPARLIIGSEKNRVGKIFVDMTGGTEGSKKNYEHLAVAGVGTIVAMHMSRDHIKEAQKHHLNVIIAGHISSDNIGVNLVLDKILEYSDIEVIPCSGFYRIDRR